MNAPQWVTPAGAAWPGAAAPAAAIAALAAGAGGGVRGTENLGGVLGAETSSEVGKCAGTKLAHSVFVAGGAGNLYCLAEMWYVSFLFACSVRSWPWLVR